MLAAITLTLISTVSFIAQEGVVKRMMLATKVHQHVSCTSHSDGTLLACSWVLGSCLSSLLNTFRVPTGPLHMPAFCALIAPWAAAPKPLVGPIVIYHYRLVL